MLICATILYRSVFVPCNYLVMTHIIVSCQNLPDITTRILVQFLVIAEDDDSDIDGAEHGKLMRLLE